MIDSCPFCGIGFESCDCDNRKRRSNMIDSSIFLGAWDEGEDSGECELILKGAVKNIFIGHVSTIILGELMKKLLKFKKEANYRYESLREDILKKLLSFRILYICPETIENHRELNEIRHEKQSQDKLNLACAIKNKCNLFIVKDEELKYNKKGAITSVVQINDRKNPKLRELLDKIKEH